MIGKLYNGAGNKFLMYDGRKDSLADLDVVELCNVFSTDGLIILRGSEDYDFNMEFYNPDGTSGMMCGNGGRCVASFAQDLGVIRSKCTFLAADGVHTAEVIQGASSDDTKVVSLSMNDVTSIKPVLKGFFLDTGARQFVIFVDDVDEIDIEKEGPIYRYDSNFAPQGTNVNFVQNCGNGLLKIRSFEKGVEGETLACGTGIVASAIAAYYFGLTPAEDGEKIGYNLIAQRGDHLKVTFRKDGTAYKDVVLTGPTERM
ncbi:MAG: diaminopimelate epimerase [Bacteroidales bacterium]|nr:diaminopimelate epimerase [Bacteroidales bacterium]